MKTNRFFMEFAPLWFALLIPLIAFAVALMLGCYSANTGFYAPRPAISSMNESCEQGRIMRTTIGGYSARIAMRFLRSSR
jgi:hypothetical protein